jgi:hypothetical protein
MRVLLGMADWDIGTETVTRREELTGWCGRTVGLAACSVARIRRA